MRTDLQPFTRTLALLALLLPAAAHAADSDKIAAAVDRAFRPLMKEHEVPGMVVAVTVNGQQQFFTYGVAAKDGNTGVTKDTLFEIGSVSKTFTAVLAGYAQATGKLALDDHPGRFMRELRGSAIDRASLLHLATYTAGLPLHLANSIKTEAAATAFMKDFKPTSEPGTVRQYSNPSIALLGRLTALALHRDFADLVEGDLLPKLGLRNSYIRVPQTAMASYAWGTKGKKQVQVRAPAGTFNAEAFGIKSSAADMIRYVEANMSPANLPPALQRAIEGTQLGYFKVGEMVQGLGWEQYPYPVTLEKLQAGNSDAIVMKPNPATALTPPQAPAGPTLFNKTGSTSGFGTYVAFVPEKKIGLVMLANRSFSTPARIAAAHAVLEVLAAETK
jgi:beta-lactamase class C